MIAILARLNRGRARTAVAGAVLALSLVATACGSSTSLAGYERDPAPSVGTYSLPAVNRAGDDFAFAANPGELLLVYFGFTNCPDVCPTTLADTRIALAELGDDADRVNLAMVTVDPDRDTAENLTSYVETFVDGSVALRTDDPALLLETATAFGVTYEVTTNDEGDVEVGHSPHVFIVDETGHLVLTWPFGLTVDDMVSDLSIMLDRFA